MSFGAGKTGEPPGPYGTNEGDIWSAEDSAVGQMLLERDGLVLIHEMMRGSSGELQERVYNVEQDSADSEIQDLIRRARAGVALLRGSAGAAKLSHGTATGRDRRRPRRSG